MELRIFFTYIVLLNSSSISFNNKGVQGVSKIKDGCNPATWMLEITSSVREITLGVDFTDVYRNSELYR